MSVRMRDLLFAILWSLLVIVGVLGAATSGHCGEKEGADSVRVGVLTPKGMVFGPVEARVRIQVLNPIESFYCPKVEIDYQGALGDTLRATFEEDCQPWEAWLLAEGRPAIHKGELALYKPVWSYTWSRKLYAGSNPITVRLTQGRTVKVVALGIPVL